MSDTFDCLRYVALPAILFSYLSNLNSVGSYLKWASLSHVIPSYLA